MSGQFDCDVLVVGLGPVGAALSALLVEEGLTVIAIDKDTAVYPLPRAAHFDHEIMRIFQALGVSEAVARHARVAPAYEFRTAAGEVLMRFELDEEISPSGWPTSFMFHQPGLENALREKLAASPRADVRLGSSFERLEADHAGVSATLKGPQGEQTVRARYLVGCDGASSPVREACGIELEDLQFDEPWLVIDVVPREGARMPEINLQICDPARPTTCVLMGPGRHRWEFMLKADETAEQALDDKFIRRLLEAWPCAEGAEIERKAVYRFHGLVAKAWRRGRVLLAGDAAHQTPPFAGQGMCSGIRDAANLAWKLAAVVRGAAKDTLLDTYQSEREPHTRALIERAIGMGRIVCISDPAAAAQRDAVMLEQRRSGARNDLPAAPNFSEGFLMPGAPAAGEIFPQPLATVDGRTQRLDDVLGAGFWLIARGPVPQPQSALPLTVVDLHDKALAPFRSALAGWLDRRAVDAVLVRPDRYVYGAGGAESLLAAFLGELAPLPQRAGGPS